MNQGKMTMFAVMAAVLLTTAIFVVFFISSANGNEGKPIGLPPAPTGGQSGSVGISDPGVSPGSETHIEITPDNVQDVVASLVRPDPFSMEIEVTRFWNGDSRTEKRSVAVLRGFTRWQTFDEDLVPIETYIIGYGSCYYWQEGSSDYFSGPEADLSPDDIGQIPTFEDLLTEDKANILAADYVDFDSEPCIQVTAEDVSTGLRRHYWVSLDKGLLWAAEVYDGDAPVYRMAANAESFRGETPAAALFRLPDGVNLLDELG